MTRPTWMWGLLPLAMIIADCGGGSVTDPTAVADSVTQPKVASVSVPQPPWPFTIESGDISFDDTDIGQIVSLARQAGLDTIDSISVVERARPARCRSVRVTTPPLEQEPTFVRYRSLWVEREGWPCSEIHSAWDISAGPWRTTKAWRKTIEQRRFRVGDWQGDLMLDPDVPYEDAARLVEALVSGAVRPSDTPANPWIVGTTPVDRFSPDEIAGISRESRPASEREQACADCRWYSVRTVWEKRSASSGMSLELSVDEESVILHGVGRWAY